MIFHPLDGAIERVRRAYEHSADLQARLAPFLERGDTPAIYPNIREVIQIESGMTVPMTMRVLILIGEICYNLRSALDYLIYELTKLDHGRAPQFFTQFPIEDSPKKFQGRRKGYLQGLNERHVAMIESLQPYSGAEWTRTLRELSNPDKHREFTQNRGALEFWVLISGEDIEFDTLPSPIQRAEHPRTREQVDLKVHITGSIAFLDGSPVIETLAKLILKVSETLEAFKSEF